jgi:NADH/NAD ratio-sensing transcriptional regulator Rex/NAD-dependent dihydropyrimidine dehydrogenase PreA subunit
MDKKVSKAVLKRLPGYLVYLKSIQDQEYPYISATALANALGMGEVQVRKDLASVSDGGRPKIGYLRDSLIDDIEQFLGYDNTTDAVLIGAGKLGQALLDYHGFEEYGLNVLAAFDINPTRDHTDGGKPILHIDKLEQLCYSVKNGALCGLGQTAPNPILSTLKYFEDEYIAHVVDKKCPAGVCKALVSYKIDPEKCKGCSLCARNCPVNAISGEIKQPYTIDTAKCIKCGACVEKCRFGAITK